MNTKLEYGKHILSQQPFSVLLGAELTSIEEGSAEITLAINQSLQQNHGFVHGGVLSYLADNCITFAAATHFNNCVTSEFKINYVRPAIGNKLIARAMVLSLANRQAVCECKVFSVSALEETLVAVSLGTIIKLEKI